MDQALIGRAKSAKQRPGARTQIAPGRLGFGGKSRAWHRPEQSVSPLDVEFVPVTSRSTTSAVTSLVERPSPSPDLVLVNPAAGAGTALDSLQALERYATRAGWDVIFSVTKCAQDLARQARRAAAAHQRILVLGGDGSFQDLVNAVADFQEVTLGILPAGCGNDLASSLGLPAHPVRAAEMLEDSTPVAMDVVCARTSEGNVRLFTGGGGVGLDAEASHLAATEFRRLPGRSRYLLAGARAYAANRAIDVHVTIERAGAPAERFSARALLLGVLNAPSYGAGLRFAPGARIDDGVLDLVLVRDLPFVELVQALPRAILSGEIRSRHISRFRAQRLTIATDIPRRFHGDGEILGTTPVTLQVLPRAIRVLRPRPVGSSFQ